MHVINWRSAHTEKKKEKTKATTIQRDDASTHDLLLKPIITRKHIYTPFPFSGRCYMCVCVCVSRWVARTLAHVRHERENIKSARCLPCKWKKKRRSVRFFFLSFLFLLGSLCSCRSRHKNRIMWCGKGENRNENNNNNNNMLCVENKRSKQIGGGYLKKKYIYI